MMNRIINLFRKKIIIPLTTNGVKNGLWIECYKGDTTYKKLVILYGKPLPKTIETIPFNPDKLT